MTGLDKMLIKRTPPHDFEAEKLVLAIAILDNSQIPSLIPLFDPPDLYSAKTRAMWEGVITLACREKEVSIPALHEYLEQNHPGIEMTMAEMSRVLDGVPKTADARKYAQIIRDKAKLRRVIEAASKLAGAAYDGDTDTMAGLIADLGSKKITGKREHTLAEEIRSWVGITNGNFSVTDVFNSLQGVTQKDRPNIRVALHRLKSDGVIEPSGGRDGVYRRVERELEVMDFLNAPTEGLTFDWPLDLHEICTIFPKDIVCFAGAQNAGKTAIAVDFIRRNQDKWDIHYFNCEMSASRLRDRLSKVDDMPLDAWKFKPYTRSDDFADVIQKDAVNIIDYLEIVDNYWEVAKKLKDIHKKLDHGIAIVLLQKDEFRDTGRGGTMSLEKPVLYVALNHGKAKIVKAKSWKGAENPNKKIVEFKLVHGWKFVPQGHWHSEEAGETMDRALGKTKFRLR